MATPSERDSSSFRPWRDGFLTGLAVFLVAVISIVYLDYYAAEYQEAAIREDLSRLARGASGLVDGDKHERLTQPEQMDSPEYRETLEPLVDYHKNLPEIAYLYTLVERDGKFHFGLDTASAAERLGFEREMEVSPLLSPYESDSPEEDAAEMEALRQGKVYVSRKPFSDPYGDFLSGVAPVRNSQGKVVAIVGVDLNVDDYMARMKGIRMAGVLSIILALALGTLLGLLVWRIRRRSAHDQRAKHQAVSEKSTLEERDRQLIKAFGQIVYRHRIDTDQIDWTGDCKKILGIAPEDLPRHADGWILNIAPAQREAVQAEYQKMVGQGIPFNAEYRFLRNDGSYTWVQDRGVVLHDKTSGAVYVDGVLQDISERKAAEEEMISAKERAETGERTKSEFLAVMSHEIRTPLNGVIGYANLLLESSLTEHQREYLESIQLCSRSLLDLLNDILDFSKMESGKMELESTPFSLRKNLSAVAALHAHQATVKHLNLSCQFEETSPDWILGDGNRLRQILINLVGNALKFTENGHVRILLQPGSAPHRFRVAIEDTGIGIPADKLERLFKPFSQADSSISRKYGGTGLGLAICARLVEMMEGTLRVESLAGQGSRFLLELPFLPASPAQIQEALDAAQVPLPPSDEAPSLRILVAEDNAVNRRLISRVLRDLGHEVDLVSNGRECLAAAAAQSYDMIFMDLQMPGMDGFEAAQQLRAQGNGIWITALTAEDLESDTSQCLAAGMNDYVAKPFTKDLIRASIERSFQAREKTR